MFPLLAPEPWQEDALCAQTDPEMFFPEKGSNATPVDAARRVCRSCLVAADCLDYALRTNEHYGVWGGLTPKQRRRIARQLDTTTTTQESA